MSQSGGMKTTY